MVPPALRTSFVAIPDTHSGFVSTAEHLMTGDVHGLVLLDDPESQAAKDAIVQRRAVGACLVTVEKCCALYFSILD